MSRKNRAASVFRQEVHNSALVQTHIIIIIIIRPTIINQ